MVAGFSYLELPYMDVKGVIHHGGVGDDPLFNVAHSEVLVNSLMVKGFAVNGERHARHI